MTDGLLCSSLESVLVLLGFQLKSGVLVSSILLELAKMASLSSSALFQYLTLLMFPSKFPPKSTEH